MQRRLEPALGQDGRVDAARELTQLGEARLQLVLRAREQRLEVAVPRGAGARAAQQQREGDQPRLGAVVQVALEAPALGVAGLHEPRARGPQLLQARAQLGVEVGDVAAQQAAEERKGHEPGRDERGPPGGVPRAAPGHRDEQERQQRAHVDRGELEALERPGVKPAPDGPDERHDEQDEVEQRPEAGEQLGEGGVAPDQQQVLRTVVASELPRAAEQQRGDEREREDQVPGDRQATVEPGRQPPRREAQAEVEEHAAPQRAGELRERVDERRVRGVEREQEPREAEQDHQRADPALRPDPRRVQAGADEAPPHDGAEHRPHDLGVLVVARELEHHHAGAADQRGGDDGPRRGRGDGAGCRPGHRGPARTRAIRATGASPRTPRPPP